MARPSRRLGNLPAETTSFVGRRRELAEVKQKLAQGRLVSLVGPGGVGKTRLGMQAAAAIARGFADGDWLVELAEIRDPALVSNAVMAALDLRDQAGADPLAIVLTYLKDRQLLLVLDNCEHLLEAAGRVLTELMKAAAGVRVIVTSREPLNVAGEHVLPVPPLDLPPVDDADLEGLRHNEAVSLFIQRAAEAAGGFVLDASNHRSVVDICRRLDGLPLAIELAAVRTRALSVEQIRDRLRDRFSLLTGGSRAALARHQTLRTTIDWSYELLTEKERALLRRLCVFAGRFTLDDAEAVCAVETQTTLALISSLVDKSLVFKDETKSEACYRLHETMREYAAGKLRESGETELIGTRCTEYFRTTALLYAEDARYHLPEWLDWAEMEIDNIRAVLHHCLDRRDGRRGLALAMSLGWYWITRSTSEGVYWLDALLPHGPTDPVAQFWAYFQRAFLAVLKFDPVSAQPPIALAIARAREIGQPELLANALSMASIASNMAGDSVQAARLLGEAANVTSPLEDVQAKISLLQARSMHGFFSGDMESVGAAAIEGIRRAREANDTYSLEMMLLNLGGMALMSGDADEAKRLYSESLQIARRIDDRVAQYALLDSMGCQAAISGQPRLAAQL
ncbi:MAG TPA: NB-ARC domain-containing protein, partial [Candidatus Dormibacteraeota bacterium]